MIRSKSQFWSVLYRSSAGCFHPRVLLSLLSPPPLTFIQWITSLVATFRGLLIPAGQIIQIGLLHSCPNLMSVMLLRPLHTLAPTLFRPPWVSRFTLRQLSFRFSLVRCLQFLSRPSHSNTPTVFHSSGMHVASTRFLANCLPVNVFHAFGVSVVRSNAINPLIVYHRCDEYLNIDRLNRNRMQIFWVVIS